jgi:starvation-inducible DNA-binding protein
MARKNDRTVNIDIGIGAKDRKAIAEGLNAFLADTIALYQKTHAFHWNVQGPMFQTLHLMFETQYNELFLATDAIAERIRALGFPVKATHAELARLTSIDETAGVPKALEMAKLLMEGHQAAASSARRVFPLAERASDEATVDLLTQRLQVHEKTAWMLRSTIASE